MGGGRLRRPPLINYQFYLEKILKHTTNMQIHTNICKTVEKYIKKYKHLQEIIYIYIYIYQLGNPGYPSLPQSTSGKHECSINLHSCDIYECRKDENILRLYITCTLVMAGS